MKQVSILLVLVSLVSAPLELGAGQEPARSICGGEEGSPAALARRLEPLGEEGRAALLRLTASSDRQEALCGVVGLAALGDRRAIPHLATLLPDPSLADHAYMLARAAAFLAGGPEPDLGPAMRPVVDALREPGAWKGAGHDAIWLLGEIDDEAARQRLLGELKAAGDDATTDAVVHALARQGEPGARPVIDALGVEAARAKSGNATPEQARRLGAVAFYQLALSPAALADGLATLGTIAVRDQEATAAWAVHTLCARAVRRPAERAAIDAHRQGLVDELDRRGISWRASQGRFGCAEPAR